MTGTHILSNQDPQALKNEVDKFTNKKENVETHYSTTPVVIGVLPNRQLDIIVIATCLIFWETSEEDWRSHLFAQKTLIQKA